MPNVLTYNFMYYDSSYYENELRTKKIMNFKTWNQPPILCGSNQPEIKQIFYMNNAIIDSQIHVLPTQRNVKTNY